MDLSATDRPGESDIIGFIKKEFQPPSSVKSLLCFRSDGTFLQMDGAAMVFPSELTESDEGLYTCRASFYHHTAAVNIQVEVMSEDKLFGEHHAALGGLRATCLLKKF